VSSERKGVYACLYLYFSCGREFLKQKSRNSWLNLGDGNNSFFHKSVTVRNSSDLIKTLMDEEGTKVEDQQMIKEMAIGFYQKLLGSTSHEFNPSKAVRVSQLIKRKFSNRCVAGMEAVVIPEEIRKVVFAMNKQKAPRPDGFSAGFFQKAWSIVGEDVSDAILEFFQTGRLLHRVNATILTLVPKKKNPASMGDYKPISCCNLMYKSIAKILANRLLLGLEDIISPNQGAFILGRSISENILLAQGIVCDYHKQKGKPRCTLKVDLMKAYDSISWEFILHCLLCFGAPRKFVAWIRQCITHPSYSIALNGTLVEYFKGRKGHRQGDSMSPYLFVIAMEVLSLLLEEETSNNPLFDFHPRCARLRLNHRCFADDLLIFSAASINSVQIVKEVLGEFEALSGLRANPSRSTCFCAGISDQLKGEVVSILQMSEGSFPVHYLGVPLTTKRLTATDCEMLVSKITARIDSWVVRKLSFAGRLQLISSILYSLQVYWSRIFILPKKVIKLIEQKFNRFLWCGLDVKARAKVAWERVCAPKREGGGVSRSWKFGTKLQ
jgi:hypothetical protein